MELFGTIIGWVGAVCLSIAFLPQTYKLLKNKDTTGLSWISYSIYEIGVILFILYGFKISNWQLFGANLFAFVINTMLLSLIFYNMLKNSNLKLFQTKKQKTTEKLENIQ